MSGSISGSLGPGIFRAKAAAAHRAGDRRVSHRIEVRRRTIGFWVRPETAAIRMPPRIQPTAPSTENANICHPFNLMRSGSSKKSVNSLLISMIGSRRDRLAPKHQMRPRCPMRAAGTISHNNAAPAAVKPAIQYSTRKVYPPIPKPATYSKAMAANHGQPFIAARSRTLPKKRISLAASRSPIATNALASWV